MALHYQLECDCGYELQTASGMYEGVFLRTYQCMSCKNYMVAKFNEPTHSCTTTMSDGLKVRIKAIGIYNEEEKKGEGFKFNKIVCSTCGSTDLIDLERIEIIDSNQPENTFNVHSKLDCPNCGKKLIYKMWAIS